MPELPEVEVTCRALTKKIIGNTITTACIRQPQLRWPVSRNLRQCVIRQKIKHLSRRAKYLIITLEKGNILIHLGMTGRLSVIPQHIAPSPHDHVDFVFDNGTLLRYNDSRRFGSIFFCQNTDQHPLLLHLGVEPLSAQFNGSFLYQSTRQRSAAIKNIIMNAHIVVGIGNIYANEALFLAKIHPARPGLACTPSECATLVKGIQSVLKKAIKAGGSSIKDFYANEHPGYFQLSHNVYQRENLPCSRCKSPIQSCRIGQRSTFFCPLCQRY